MCKHPSPKTSSIHLRTAQFSAKSILTTGTINLHWMKNLERIMTFSTPWANYRYKRLAFGGKNSQDLFDAKIAKVISGIPHVLNNWDDIMVGGKDWEEHNENLETLLE